MSWAENKGALYSLKINLSFSMAFDRGARNRLLLRNALENFAKYILL